MTIYRVRLTNRDTHEEFLAEVECDHPVEAQQTALIEAFRVLRWSRTEAAVAERRDDD